MEERLQKVLARAGIASRRKAEELIARGRVSVDGRRVTELGTRVDPRRARVEVDGRRIVAEPLVYVALHKPRLVMCTLRDPEGRPTVMDYVRGVGARVYPVGRLDFHTSGILLLTNDGEFSSVLQHPRKQAPKVYVAKVSGELGDEALASWSERIEIDGRLTQPAAVKRLRYAEGKTWIEVTLREGRNRQVRRLGEHTGFQVMRLARQSYAGITVEGLRPGEWRFLSADELRDLKQEFGVPRRVRAAPPAAPKKAPRKSPLREPAASSSFKGPRKPGRDAAKAPAFEKPRRAGEPARGGAAPPFRGARKTAAPGFKAAREPAPAAAARPRRRSPR